MDSRDRTRPLRTFVVLSALFLLLAVMFLMPALPRIYPESEIIQALFGKGRFAVFWVIIIACLLIGVIWEQQRIKRERHKYQS